MTGVAERIMREHGYDPTAPPDGRHEIRPDAIRRFGLLSESIQVQASIVLADLTRRGMDLDVGGRRATLLRLPSPARRDPRDGSCASTPD